MRLKHLLYTVSQRMRSLFRRQRVEQELGEELHDHFQRQRRKPTAAADAISGLSNKARRSAGTCAG